MLTLKCETTNIKVTPDMNGDGVWLDIEGIDVKVSAQSMLAILVRELGAEEIISRLDNQEESLRKVG